MKPIFLTGALGTGSVEVGTFSAGGRQFVTLRTGDGCRVAFAAVTSPTSSTRSTWPLPIA